MSICQASGMTRGRKSRPLFELIRDSRVWRYFYTPFTGIDSLGAVIMPSLSFSPLPKNEQNAIFFFCLGTSNLFRAENFSTSKVPDESAPDNHSSDFGIIAPQP
ncbi:hypothetical protein AVEN_252017-1 [Araneus ventricosus]|uniref:Uncharacterized protein n=1 Tax=Araneus ventricosus TaxID=182803 RepID=A0A4Y2PWT3_ARAVE|nr:hypothetical protein AVEN_252017-1 [Araneus ventricosus]